MGYPFVVVYSCKPRVCCDKNCIMQNLKLWLVVGGLMVGGCTQSKKEPAPRPSTTEPVANSSAPAEKHVAAAPSTAPSVRAISASEFRRMQHAHPEYVVLDVRTPAEFDAGYIPGAKLIDYRAADFNQKIAQLDRSKTYLVYCRTGNRSSHACGKLDAMGLKSYNLTGGIVAWNQAKLPTTRP